MDEVRSEIASVAARMIVEEGVSYGTAKKRAVKQLLGNKRVNGNILPDNAQIEDEVRIYNQIFYGDTQPERLLHLRKLALEVMEELVEFEPHLTGAVLNGTAHGHSEIRLQLFADNHKDVAIHLLNQGINFDVSETPHFKKHHEQVETLSFIWKNEGVHLMLYPSNDLRGALKVKAGERGDRADLAAVKSLIA